MKKISIIITIIICSFFTNKIFANQQLENFLETKICKGCNLKETDLSNKNFDNSILTGAVLKNSNLSNTSFINSDFSKSYLIIKNYRWNNLKFAKINDLSIKKIISIFYGGADLSNAVFYKSNLTGSNLEDANLDGTIFCGTIMPDGNINNQGCLNKLKKDRSCIDCDFTSLNISKLNLSESNLEGSNF